MSKLLFNNFKYELRNYTFLILLCTLSACTHPNSVYFNNEYAKLKDADAKLLVIPVNDEIKIINTVSDSIAFANGEFASATFSEQEIFNSYIRLLLKEKTRSVLADEQTILNAKVQLELLRADIENQKIEFKLPSAKILTSLKESVNYVILFDDLSFTKIYSVDGASLGSSGDACYNVKIGFEYLIWDAKKNRVVSYGKISQKAKLLAVPQKDDYINLLDRLVDLVVQESPFVPKKIYF